MVSRKSTTHKRGHQSHIPLIVAFFVLLLIIIAVVAVKKHKKSTSQDGFGNYMEERQFDRDYLAQNYGNIVLDNADGGIQSISNAGVSAFRTGGAKMTSVNSSPKMTDFTQATSGNQVSLAGLDSPAGTGIDPLRHISHVNDAMGSTGLVPIVSGNKRNRNKQLRRDPQVEYDDPRTVSEFNIPTIIPDQHRGLKIMT